jgi:hypothetical protein
MNRGFCKIYILIFFISLLSIRSAHAESEIQGEQYSKLKPFQTLVGFTYINRRLYPAIKEPVVCALNNVFNPG